MPAQLGGHGVQAVADTQHRHIQLENDFGRLWAILGMYRFRSTGKNDAPGCKLHDVTGMGIPGPDFTVDADFPNPPRDQLGVLRTKIQDQDAVQVNVLSWHVSFCNRFRTACSWALPW